MWCAMKALSHSILWALGGLSAIVAAPVIVTTLFGLGINQSVSNSTAADSTDEFFERRLDPKPRWTMDKLSDEAAARLMRMIVPFRFHVEAVDGTWKLGQNKPEHARLSAAGQVNDPELADLMRSGQAPADG